MVTGQQQRVETAFALGWHVAELRHARDERPPPAKANRLCQIQQFDRHQRTDLLRRQIRKGLESLRRLGFDASDAQEAIRSFVPPIADEPLACQQAVADAHVRLLTALIADDYRLGKAYALGVEMGETVLLSYAKLKGRGWDDELAELWHQDRIQLLVQQLGDLKTAFADHAADATAATLHEWSDTAEHWRRQDLAAIADQRLYPQGAAWRAMLSGEKLPTDYLTVSEYTRAVGHLLRDYGAFARRSLLSSAWLPIVLVLTLIPVGALLYLAVRYQAQVQATYASLIGLLGFFGVTLGTVVAAVKKALATAEDRLWQAEKAAAIAIAIDWVPVKRKGSHVERLGMLTVDDDRPPFERPSRPEPAAVVVPKPDPARGHAG